VSGVLAARVEAASLSHRKRKPLPLFTFIGVHSRFRRFFMANTRYSKTEACPAG